MWYISSGEFLQEQMQVFQVYFQVYMEDIGFMKKRGNFHSELACKVFSLTHTWPAEGGLCSEQYPFKTAWAESDTIVELAQVCSMVLGTLPPPQQLLFPLPPWLYLFYLGCRCIMSQIPFDEVLLLCSHDLYFWNNISLNLPGWQGSLRLLI